MPTPNEEITIRRYLEAYPHQYHVDALRRQLIELGHHPELVAHVIGQVYGENSRTDRRPALVGVHLIILVVLMAHLCAACLFASRYFELVYAATLGNGPVQMPEHYRPFLLVAAAEGVIAVALLLSARRTLRQLGVVVLAAVTLLGLLVAWFVTTQVGTCPAGAICP